MFVKNGCNPGKVKVTGIPNFDNSRRYLKNNFPDQAASYNGLYILKNYLQKLSMTIKMRALRHVSANSSPEISNNGLKELEERFMFLSEKQISFILNYLDNPELNLPVRMKGEESRSMFTLEPSTQCEEVLYNNKYKDEFSDSDEGVRIKRYIKICKPTVSEHGA